MGRFLLAAGGRTLSEQWIELVVTVHPDLAEGVANFCHELDSPGLVVDDLDNGLTRLTAFMPAERGQDSFSRLAEYLKDLAAMFPEIPEPKLELVPVKSENWAVMWQDHFKPIEVGERLLVTPPWIHPDAGNRSLIVIEPADAFGTGTHETTQGCLLLIEKAILSIADPPDTIRFLDVGCGSGILAIAARKLGALDVTAIDNDPAATASAKRNVELNSVDTGLTIETRSVEDLSGAWDVVVANLDPRGHKYHAERLARLFTRALIVSGVPIDQWGEIRELFLDKSLRLEEEVLGAEWASGLFRRSSAVS